jgi:inorganic triphosphatase YgiF
MAHDHVEIEAKYAAPAGSDVPWLERLHGVSRVDPPLAQSLVAIYFDTPDLRLARLGSRGG